MDFFLFELNGIMNKCW